MRRNGLAGDLEQAQGHGVGYGELPDVFAVKNIEHAPRWLRGMDIVPICPLLSAKGEHALWGLLGVVVRFEDFHEAVQCFIGAGAFCAQHDDVAERSS
jgi:hypothetical protein